MSDFKVGDKVKCIRADSYGKLTEGKTYTITSIVIGFTNTGGSSVCVDGIRDDWWYADRFELLHQPVEVHTGGPYVARSEYERVCVERDALLEDVKELHREGAVAAAMRDLREQLVDVPHGKQSQPLEVAGDTYTANCGELRLVSVLTEVVAGWMNDEYKQKYREAITNAVRRMAADFVTLLPDADECQGCAGRGAGYCPTCKKSRYGTCGDCGKDLSDEERGQFRCELCSQYPSPEAQSC